MPTDRDYSPIMKIEVLKNTPPFTNRIVNDFPNIKNKPSISPDIKKQIHRKIGSNNFSDFRPNILNNKQDENKNTYDTNNFKNQNINKPKGIPIKKFHDIIRQTANLPAPNSDRTNCAKIHRKLK